MKEKPYHHGNLRNKLIETGIELINEVGLRDFSLRKVAAKCNVSHAAPYSHFKDKDDLISVMRDHVTQQFIEKLHNAIVGLEDNPTALLLLGQAYIDFFIEHPQYFQFIFYSSGISIDLDKESPDDYPPFALFRETAYRCFRRMGLKEEAYSMHLIGKWSMVHGVAALLTNSGISYSGNWHSVFANTFVQKGENL